MAAIKLGLCLTKWQDFQSHKAAIKVCFTFCCVTAVVQKQLSDDWAEWKTCTGLNNNLYQCLKSIYSYKMVLLLVTSPYKMSLHTLLRFLFFDVQQQNLELTKNLKKQTRWFYTTRWPLKTLTKWTLQNVQFCLLGVLLQNAPVRGLLVTTKRLYINIRVRIWGKGSHPASCKHKLVGFWKPL